MLKFEQESIMPKKETPEEEELRKSREGVQEFIKEKLGKKKEKREKIEDEAGQERLDLLNEGVIKRIFSRRKERKKEEKKEGKEKEEESRYIGSAEEWVSDANDLVKSVKTGLESYKGISSKGRPLTLIERIVRGVGAIGAWSAASIKLEMRYGGILARIKYGVKDKETREKIIEAIEKEGKPLFEEMREFTIEGEATEAVGKISEEFKKEGDEKSADIFDKSAEFMRKHPEIVKKVEEEGVKIFKKIFLPDRDKEAQKEAV